MGWFRDNVSVPSYSSPSCCSPSPCPASAASPALPALLPDPETSAAAALPEDVAAEAEGAATLRCRGETPMSEASDARDDVPAASRPEEEKDEDRSATSDVAVAASPAFSTSSSGGSERLLRVGSGGRPSGKGGAVSSPLLVAPASPSASGAAPSRMLLLLLLLALILVLQLLVPVPAVLPMLPVEGPGAAGAAVADGFDCCCASRSRSLALIAYSSSPAAATDAPKAATSEAAAAGDEPLGTDANIDSNAFAPPDGVVSGSEREAASPADETLPLSLTPPSLLRLPSPCMVILSVVSFGGEADPKRARGGISNHAHTRRQTAHETTRPFFHFQPAHAPVVSSRSAGRRSSCWPSSAASLL